MTDRLRPLLAPALATLLAGALLIGLGIWQLHRLAWKEALLARIEARTRAAPTPLPPRARWTGLRPSDYEYRHVVLVGSFDNADETLILRASADGPGYHVITPLRLAGGGGTVLVDRGFVPASNQAVATREAGEPRGEVRVTGLMRAPEPRNIFTPADDPATGTFYTRDPAAIAAHDGIVDAAPFSVDADASMVNPGGLPQPAPAGIDIPNNHFSYAMTWFGFALGLFGVFASFAWSRLATRGPAVREHSTAGSL